MCPSLSLQKIVNFCFAHKRSIGSISALRVFAPNSGKHQQHRCMLGLSDGSTDRLQSSSQTDLLHDAVPKWHVGLAHVDSTLKTNYKKSHLVRTAWLRLRRDVSLKNIVDLETLCLRLWFKQRATIINLLYFERFFCF